MSPAPARLLAWFVAPAAPPGERPSLRLVPLPPDPAIPPAAPTSPGGTAAACVVGAGSVPQALGVALAHRLARRRREVVVCVWAPAGHDAVRPRRADRRARRLATALAVDGCEAVAAGRAVRVLLPDAPEQAARTAARLADAPGRAVVTVLAGPRDAAFDTLLAGQRLVLAAMAADAPAALAELATASLGGAAPAAAVRAVRVPARWSGRARGAALASAVEALA